MKIQITFLPLCFFLNSFSQHVTQSPAEVIFISTDVDLFWNAFDRFSQDTTKNPFEDYLKKGSNALKDFFFYDEDPAKALKKKVKLEMEYYSSVRPFTSGTNGYKNKAREYYNAFKAMYPYAELPPVYFVVGLSNRGGTATSEGIIIGIETFGDSTLTTTRGIRPTPMEQIPRVVATCLVFYNQKPAHTGHTLIRQAVIHGSADFLSAIIVGEPREKIFENPNYRYGEVYEESLVKEFLRQRNETDLSGWFYYGNTNGRPGNLGHWIGYKITEAYYHSVSDKVKAIDEILKINDFEKFLMLSGYAEPFRN
jgi:hypothetical protein